MKFTIPNCALTGCLVLVPMGAFAKAPARAMDWQAGVSLYTESGNYGTDSHTTVTYIPFSLKRFFNLGDLEGVFPLISVRTEGQVVVVGGVPNKRGRGSGSGAVVPVESHTGLGDMLLKGRLYGIDETDRLPAIDLVGKIKFPTASSSRNLGTGEFDEGGGLEFNKTIRGRYLALGDVGYTHIGDPDGEDLNNQWYLSFGGGYYFIPLKWSGTITYEERRTLVSGNSNPRDFFFATDYRLNDRVRIFGGLMAGLSDGAGDVGLSLGSRMLF